MVENQEANIDDTGVLSKDAKVNLKSCSEEREVTDYWDISGAMDSTPGGTIDLRGNMKLQGAADEATADHADAIENHAQNDNVTLTTADNSNAMKSTYCENGQSAISETGIKASGNLGNNTNTNNSNNSSCVPQIENIPDSKDGHMSKNSDPLANSDENNKDDSNMSGLLRESDTVGTERDNTKGEGCDVNDTVSHNMMTSGAKDNCPDGENKVVLSVRDQMLSDSNCTEERFRIDRKKLEQMLQAASEGRGQSGEEFFQKIMDDTGTFITWPSKLKIGAKSKKDPHIRICGKPDTIKQARQRIMLSLDTKSNRVTIKMDVSHTEHSHVIGKGGNNIKRVMLETGCHIHFPDSNRNTAGEKSNQVSITGHPEGVESARTKIRSLLPIVLQFEIPNTGLPIPDLNSPIIQHLVQVYGISIQFKQRAKVYSTSCTVRGSADNTDGLETGIQMLMTQVAGTQLPVQTQIEIAPQHHSYMLTKPGLNVTTISQTTGARIIFPDHSALPKKSTVYVSGTIDSVIMARHKLMGCLPLLLMFDMKDEIDGPSNDAVKIANLMETLDISINLKSKPKQPSRTVIIKGIECNIYNMFEARGKLLGLDSSGVTRPAKSQSPKLSGRNASITPTPVILLAHSHVPTPTVQTAVIGLTEQKPVTPIPILGNHNYVLTHSVPSNPMTPRQVPATLPAVHTPSQSPFPTLPNGGIPNPAANQHLVTKPNLIRRSEDIVNNGYPLVSNSLSPPTTVQITRSASLPTDQPLYQVNASSIGKLQQHSNMKFNLAVNGDIASLRAESPYVYRQSYSTAMQNGNSQRGSQRDEFETGSRKNVYPDFPKHENSHEDNRVMLSNYDPRSIPSLERLLPKDEERIAQQNRDIEKKMNEHLMRQAGVHYGKNAPILSDEDLLRQQLGMAEQNDLIQSSSNNTVPQNVRQSFVHSIRSPDSISESRGSITSDRNSPLSSISDRYNASSNPRMGGYEQFDEQSVIRGSPPTNSANNFQSLANRDINSLSPMSSVSHHRSPPQIVLNHNSHGGFEGNNLSDNPADLDDMYQHTQQSIEDISSGPPPGFEGFTPKTKDYENYRKLATKAMTVKPVPSEVRTPTDVWAGWGFSKSMPFGMKEELKKLAASKGRFSRLPTTFENGEEIERNQPSPVDEETEYGMEQSSPNRLRVPLDTGIGRGGSNLNAWRRRRLANMNLSLGGNMGLNYISSVQRPAAQKHSAFTPIHPNESLNRSSSSPKNNPANVNESLQSRKVINSPFNNSGNEGTLHVSLPDKANQQENRMNMSSTPTIQDSLGLTANSAANPKKVEPDISDVLNRLGLSKYISVFHQQEVDYQTFLTLTDQDLKELGITTFGPRKKILLAINDLSKDRDIFSGPKPNDAVVHENLSDHMLQLQRLELQQHRDNPQTAAPVRLDSHPLLSPPRQLFNAQSQRMQNHPEDSGFYEGNNQRNNDRMRSSRLWQNSRTGGSNSGRW